MVRRVWGCGVLIRFAGILVFEVHNPADCGLPYPVQGQHDPAPTIVTHSFDAGSGSRICGPRVVVMRGPHRTAELAYVVSTVSVSAKLATRLSSAALPFSAVAADGRPMIPDEV